MSRILLANVIVTPLQNDVGCFPPPVSTLGTTCCKVGGSKGEPVGLCRADGFLTDGISCRWAPASRRSQVTVILHTIVR